MSELSLKMEASLYTETLKRVQNSTRLDSETTRLRAEHKQWRPERMNQSWTSNNIHPSFHLGRYSPFRALASLIRLLNSSLLAALLFHPLIPNSCRASHWTTSAHLVLGLPTVLAVWKFPFKTLSGILCFSILIIRPAHPSILNLTSSTMFGSLYKL